MRVGVRAPNTEADEKSAYNNVQVGDGPQQREIGFQFLQTMCELATGHEAGGGFGYPIMCKLGWDDRNKFLENTFLSHSIEKE